VRSLQLLDKISFLHLQGGQPAIVMELCLASVQTYLRNKPATQIAARSMMALDIAGWCACMCVCWWCVGVLVFLCVMASCVLTCGAVGLHYLADNNILHRDLAGEKAHQPII
jgi:hypothetical protein